MKQRKRSDRKQFICYAIYVYTLSTILTVTSGAIDSIESLPDHLKPGFGVENCFIKGLKLFSYFMDVFIQFFFGSKIYIFIKINSRKPNFNISVFLSANFHYILCEYSVHRFDNAKNSSLKPRT